MTDGVANSDAALVQIGGRGYSWTIEDHELIVRNAQGDVLDPTAAEVVMSLGGDEPAWLGTVESLRAAYHGSQPDELDGVAAAANALGTSRTQQAELARTTADGRILLALAASGIAQVGANQLCNLDVWGLVMGHRNPEVRWTALADNEVLPWQLWSYPDTDTRVRVARNSTSPLRVLDSLSSDDLPVRVAVAANPTVPAYLAERLARDSEWSVRRSVAANPACPKSCFLPLFRDRTLQVRVAMVTNPNVSTGLAASRISADPTPAVHSALATRVDLSAKSLAQLERRSRRDPLSQYKLTCTRIAHHPSCSPSLKRRLEEIEEELSSLTAEEMEKWDARTRRGRHLNVRQLLLYGMLATFALAAAIVGIALLSHGRSGQATYYLVITIVLALRLGYQMWRKRGN